MFLFNVLKGAHVDNIQNIGECYCCQELEGCIESMSSELVLQDLAVDEQK